MKRKIHLAAAVILMLMMAVTLTSCGIDADALHISYSADENYGTGDYLYSTVTFTGSEMSRETVCSVRELEELAKEDGEIGYEGEYSMLTRGSIFSTHEMSGAKLYEMLVYMGLDEGTADNTDVKIVSADGYVTVMTLGEIRQSDDNTYASMDSGKAEVTGVPVILAFGSDGLPLTGPVGTREPGEDVSEAEGFSEEADNVGGPVRLIAGQKSPDEYNAPDNAKWVREVIVGEDNDADEHARSNAKKKCLSVTVKDADGKTQTSGDFTWRDIETFDEKVGNYYGDTNYYGGVNLWSFLASSLDFSSREGTVKFAFTDGSNEEIDIEYFRNIDGDYSGYTTEKDGLSITGVIPALGYSVNGAASGDGVYALLPAAKDYVKTSTAKPIESIELILTGEGELSENPYGSYKVSFDGDGMEEACEMTVSEMESYADLRVKSGDELGVSLAGVLEEAGIAFDADEITVKGTSEVRYTWDELDEKRDEIFLVTREDGKTPEDGGPVKMKGVEQITEITVSAKEGQWTHDKSPYNEYLSSKLKVSGSAVEERTYTLKELENSDYIVKDTFAASNGVNGYAGVVLKSLIRDNLKDGIGEPGSITVIGRDGYETQLDVDDVMHGIDSKYQDGEHRDVIIAFALNGEPLVKNENAKGFTGENGFGPMRLVVENQISKWVKSVKEVKIEK